MRKTARRVLSIILAITMVVFTMPEWVMPGKQAQAAGGVTYTVPSEVEDVKDILEQYGLIGFSELKIEGHQHTNIMTGALESDTYGVKYQNECSIRKEYRQNGEILPNYVKSFKDLSMHHTTEQNHGTIVFGSSFGPLMIGTEPVVGSFYVNGKDNITLNGHMLQGANEVIQDTDTAKYVDLDNLKKSFGYYSGQLAAMKQTKADPSNPEYTATIAQNYCKIDVAATEGLIVLNYTADQLRWLSETQLNVNFPTNANSGVLINIDMAGKSSFSMKYDKLTYNNVTTFFDNDGRPSDTPGENVYNTDNNRVYFNFYDSSQPDGNYRGKITCSEVFLGTLIAPYAELTSKGINGVVVVDKACVEGESHKIRGIVNIPDPLPIDEADFNVIKTYEGKNLAELSAAERDALLSATEFTLYKEDGTTKAAGPKSLTWNAQEQRAEVTFDNIDCSADGDTFRFQLKETASPSGYVTSDVVVDCKVTRNPATGLLETYYKKSTENDSAYSKDFPQFENEQKQAITPSVTLDDWTYGGDGKEPVLGDNSNPGEGTVVYEYRKASETDDDYTTEKPTDAGDYVVRVTIGETDRYLGGTATDTFTIRKAPNGLDTEQASDQVMRGGKTLDLSQYADGADGTVTYTIEGNAHGCTINSDGVFTSGNSMHTIRVKITATGDENHERAERIVNVRITDRNNLHATVELDDWVYGETAKDATITLVDDEGNSVEVPADAVKIEYKRASESDRHYSTAKPVNAGDYIVRVSVAETDKYKAATATDPFTIKKAPNGLDTEDATESVKRRNSINLSDYAEGANGIVSYRIDGTNLGGRIDPNGTFHAGRNQTGTVKVVIAAAGDTNHLPAERIVYVVVTDLNPLHASVELDNWDYGEDAEKPVVTLKDDRGNPVTIAENYVTIEYKKANEDDTKYTTTVPTEAGDYVVRVVVEETDDYCTALATDHFSINPIKNTMSEADAEDSVMRGGHSLNLSDYAANADGNVTYELIGDDLGCTVDENGKLVSGNAEGTVTVKITAEGDNNHKPGERIVTVTIEDKNDIDVSVELDDWTYGEDAEEATVTVKDADGQPLAIDADDITIEYKPVNEENAPYTTEVPTEAGDYYVRATVKETEKHNGGTNTDTFTINKADNGLNTNAAEKSVMRDGKKIDLTPYADGADGTVTYTIAGADNGCSINNKHELVSGDNEGIVTVKITAAGDNNHEAAERIITINITDKNPIVPEVVVSDKTYDGSASPVSLTEDSNPGDGKVTYEYRKDGSSTWTEEAPVDAGTYYVRAKVEETSEYNGATSEEKQYKINKAENPATITTEDMETEVTVNTKDDDDHSIDLSDCVKNAEDDAKITYRILDEGTTATDAEIGKDGTLKPGKEPGEVKVEVTVAGDENHKPETKVITITVKDKESVTATVELDDWDYGTTAKNETVTVKGSDGTPLTYSADDIKIEYKKDGEDVYTTTKPDQAGNYTVLVTVAETSENKGTTATDTFTINKVNDPAEVTNTASVMRDNEINLSNKVTNAVGNVSYEIYETDAQGCTVDKDGVFTAGKEASGEIRVKVTIEESDNYLGREEIITVTVTDKKTIDPQLTIADWNYGETASEPQVGGNDGRGTETIEYKPAGSQDSEYTIEVPTKAGTYDARLTIGETKEYCGGQTATQFEIKKTPDPAVISTEGKETEVTVNTKEDDDHTIKLSDFVEGAEGNVKYEIEKDGTTATDATIRTDGTLKPGKETGEVKVRVTVEESDNHTETSKIITITVVDKKDVTPEVVVSDKTYDGSASPVSLTEDSNPGDGKVTYEYRKDGSSTWTEEAPVDAGTYYVRAKVEETSEYNGATSEEKQYKINKAENPATITTEDMETEVTVNTKDDDDHSIDLSDCVKNAEDDAKITYRILDEGTTATDAEIGKDGTLKPGKEPGEVKVEVTVAGDENHKPETKVITITVKDKESVTATVELDDWDYGTTAKNETVTVKGSDGTPLTYSADDIKIEYKKDGEDVYTTTKPDQAGNYTVLVTVAETSENKGTTATDTFTINKVNDPAEVTNTASVMRDNEINLSNKVTNAVGNVSYEIYETDAQGCTVDKDGVFTAGKEASGEIRVKVTIEESDNYLGREEIITVTVTDKKTIDPQLTIADWNYGETASEPQVGGNDGRGTETIEYKPAGSQDSEYTIEVPTKAGTYDARLTIGETKEYCGGQTATQFEIKKTPDPAVISTEGKETEVTVNTKEDDDHTIKLSDFVEGAEGNVKYEIEKDGTTATDATIRTDGTLKPGKETGEVKVRVTVEESDNHTETSKIITIKVTDKKEISPKVEIDDWTYGEDPAKPQITGNVSGGKVTVEYKRVDEDESAYTAEVPTEAGNYVVRVTVDETEEYQSGTAKDTFVIKKAKDPAVIDVDGGTVTNNTGSEDKNTVDVSELVTGEAGDVTYKIISDESDSATIDKNGVVTPGSKPGDILVEVTISDSENYEGKTVVVTIHVTDKKTDELEVTVDDETFGGKEPEPKFEKPEGCNTTVITYSGTLADGTSVEFKNGEVPTEAGSYIVTVVCETPDTVYTGKAKFEIRKAVPEIGTVAADEVHNSTDVSKTGLRRSNNSVPGKLTLEETELTVGTKTYHWTFTPDDSNNYTKVEGTVSITMTEHAWSAWEIVYPATAEKDGLMRRVCTICGEIETQPITKLAKEPEQENPNPPENEEPKQEVTPKDDKSDKKGEQDPPEVTPKTGDAGLLMWWFVLLGAATVVLIVMNRRREDREDTIA